MERVPFRFHILVEVRMIENDSKEYLMGLARSHRQPRSLRRARSRRRARSLRRVAVSIPTDPQRAKAASLP